MSPADYEAFFDQAPIALWVEDFSALKKHFDGLKETGIDLLGHFLEKPEEICRSAALLRTLTANAAAVRMSRSQSSTPCGTSTVAGLLCCGGAILALKAAMLALAGGSREHRQQAIIVDPFTGARKQLCIDWILAKGCEQSWERVQVAVGELPEQATPGPDARLKALFDLLPLALCFSRDGVMLDVNPAYLRLFGFTSADEIRGHSVLEQVAPQCRAENLERIRNRPREPLAGYVTTGVRKNGEQFPIELSVNRVELAEGPVTMGAIGDLTARVRYQDELRELLDLQRHVIDSSPVGIAAYSEDGQCVAANEAAARVVGAPVSQLLEQNFRHLRSWKESGLLSLAEEALQSGVSLKRQIHVFTSFGREVFLSAHAAVFSRGGKRHLLMMLDDATAHTLVERDLRASEERLRTFVETTHVGIASSDADFKITYTNQRFAYMLGHEPGTVLGRRMLELVHEGDRAAFEEGARRMGHSDSYEVRFLHRDGQKVHTLASMAPSFSVEGQFNGVSCVITDISERHRMEKALARAQAELVAKERLAAVGELAAVMAHEVRNPLGVIFNSLSPLRRLVAELPEASLFLDLVGEEADRLNRIVEDLLEFSRPRAPNLRWVDPSPLVATALEATRKVLPTSGIEFCVLAKSEPILVPLDPEMMRQVLMNLLINAVQALPNGGRIAIQTGVQEMAGKRNAFFEVADNGIGLSPDAQRRLFEPFFTTKAAGTGLGLAIVRNIVRAHRGEVGCESRPGGGTSFIVMLPLEAPSELS